jgi:lysozyme
VNARLALLAAAGIFLLAVRQAFAKPADIVADGEGGSMLGDLAAPFYDLGAIVGGMKLSAWGLEVLKQREGGFQAQKYPDASGYSIGYGHFIKPWENFDDGIDEATAAQLLEADVSTAEGAVNLRVSVPLTQSQFDALVSFAYNAGIGAFTSSTLLKLLNAGDLAGAQAQFSRWIYKTVGGVKVQAPELVARRAQEAAQFST